MKQKKEQMLEALNEKEVKNVMGGVALGPDGKSCTEHGFNLPCFNIPKTSFN